MCAMGNLTGKPFRERTRLQEKTSSIQAFRHPGKKEDLGGCPGKAFRHLGINTGYRYPVSTSNVLTVSGCRYRISISEHDTDIQKPISDMWISVSSTVGIGYHLGP